MRILVTPGDFLDGETRYEKDQEYTVDDGLGLYFCRNGWAKNLDEETEAAAQPSEVDLDVHNSHLGIKDSNG